MVFFEVVESRLSLIFLSICQPRAIPASLGFLGGGKLWFKMRTTGHVGGSVG